MKTYQFKNILFEYFNSKITVDFPCLRNKIFRERLRVERPGFPFVVLKSGERARINKRYEKYSQNNKDYTRVQYRMPITFAIHDIRTNPMEAEEFVDEVIDYIETFFADNDTTHVDLSERGIIVNELLISGVRDVSSFSSTAQEFAREIDVVFEFEDIKSIESEQGRDISVDVHPF